MFKKIVAIDHTGIEEFVKSDLESLCDELIMHNDIPKADQEIIERAKGADGLLVSWNTKVSRHVIESLPGLKYIGMCCSLIDEKSANVDIAAARENGVVVKGVRDYGDEGVVEFIISQLISLYKGLNGTMMFDEQIELGNMKLGVVGLGTLGTMVADAANFFGMDIYYYNRNIKKSPYTYLELNDLVETCDVITTHLPRNTVILGKHQFDVMGTEKVFINTGLSPSFEQAAFDEWINKGNNYAIFDKNGITQLMKEKYTDIDNVIVKEIVTGFTRNARRRLAEKVIINLKSSHHI